MSDFKDMTAQQVAVEFMKSEATYVNQGLKVLTESFLHRLRHHNTVKQGVLTSEELSALFLNTENIFDFNKQLLSALTALHDVSPQHLLDGLGKLMTRMIPFFKLYTQYIMNHRETAKLLLYDAHPPSPHLHAVSIGSKHPSCCVNG
jgi:hypothetical protein